jgi:hypothetical protein
MPDMTVFETLSTLTLGPESIVYTSAPAVGLGTDLRLSASGITGAGLASDHLVHLSAFGE